MLIDADAGTRRRQSTTALLAWCAAASLGMLFMKTNSLLDYTTIRYQVPVETGFAQYVPLAAVAVALVAWHLAPRGAWAWLLLAGAVFAIPDTVLRLSPDLYHAWMLDVVPAFTGSAPTFTLIGLLGGATLMWQAGWRAVGAALIGTGLIIQLIGPVVIGSIGYPFGLDYGMTVTTLVLAVVALGGALVALVALARGGATGEPAGDEPVRPDWRVTIAGGVASVAQVLVLIWRPGTGGGSMETNPSGLAFNQDYFLHLGLVFIAIGLILGAIAGRRTLLAALSVGLMLGAFGMLIAPSVEVLREMPVLAVIAAIGSTLLGFVAALSRLRGQFGVGGLLVLFLGLLVMFGLFNSDMEYSSYGDFTYAATPVLLVIGVVAAVCSIAATGAVLADHAEPPAVLAGAATPLSLGTIAVIAHFTLHAPDGKAPFVGLLPPTAGGLLLATVALILLTAPTWRPTAPEPPEPRTPVSETAAM